MHISLTSAAVLLIFSTISFAQQSDSSGKTKNYDFKKLYSFAIQEDVRSIITTLDTLPESELSAEDVILKRKFYDRFVNNNEVFDYNTTDPLLTGLIDVYIDYWKSILLKEKTIPKTDSVLKVNLYSYVKMKYPSGETAWDDLKAKEDPWLYLSRLLKTNNYFCNVDGKTGNLYDIYIWKGEDIKNYSIELPEVNISVPVIFMNDIVTLGWEEYATFGKAYPGGWAKDSVIYCVAKAYDTTGEAFLVGYLAHESQHFSDLKIYKDIPSWELEYRAKLTELSKSNDRLYRLINYFIIDSKNDSTLYHPYAEFCVISELSRVLFNEKFVSDIERWKTIPVKDVKFAAVNALKKNSGHLSRKQ